MQESSLSATWGSSNLQNKSLGARIVSIDAEYIRTQTSNYPVFHTSNVQYQFVDYIHLYPKIIKQAAIDLRSPHRYVLGRKLSHRAAQFTERDNEVENVSPRPETWRR